MFRKVLALDELWDGDMQPCTVDGCKVVLIRIGERVHAYADRCGHLGLPLSDGYLQGCKLTCEANHYEYDVSSGRGISPQTARLTAFPVRIERGQILVDVGAVAQLSHG